MLTAAMPRGPLNGPAAWRGDELRRSNSWLRRLDAAELAALEAATAGLQVGSVVVTVPGLASTIREIRQELLHGRGFVVLRGLSPERYPPGRLAVMFWALGTQLGTAVSQNADGDLLGHVTDLGRDAADPTARIYQTNQRQGYHTDSADLVGLACLATAKSGGESSLASCSTVYNFMLEEHRELLPALFEPFATDHRGEQRSGARPYFVAPILHWFRGALSVLYQRKYIESAQRFDGVDALTPTQVAALDAFDATLEDPRVHLDMRLEPGDVQLVNNHQLLHDRTAFVDWPEPERRRHLLRLWLCPPDGRPLPPCFAERYGSVEPGRRGGVPIRT